MQLTGRETEIVELTGKGFTRRQIGEMLDIAPATVKKLVNRAAKKDPNHAQQWRASNLEMTKPATAENPQPVA